MGNTQNGGRSHLLSASNNLNQNSIRADRIQVSNLHKFLSNLEPESFSLCSKQCGLLIKAMQNLAAWLACWEKTALSAPFVRDLLILATKGAKLVEDCAHVTESSWLILVVSKMERREEFEELLTGFVQALQNYVEVMQGSFSQGNTLVNAPPTLTLALQSLTLGSHNEDCMREAKSLIDELKQDLKSLQSQAADQDRSALFKRLGWDTFSLGDLAWLLAERSEKQTGPVQLKSSGPMYKKGKLLGKGASGEVYEATWMGMEVAVKEFDCQVRQDGELKALQQTRHVNVIRAIAYHLEEMGTVKWGLLMEKMKGDLSQFVRRIRNANSELPLSVAIEILRQIAKGMAHLHELKIMHRDLKPENVLFSSWPPMSTQELHKGPGDFTAKITDFGECRTPAYNTTCATRSRGTACYRAPEILREAGDDDTAQYSNKVDVYSFGMVCYKLLTQLEPWTLPGNDPELNLPPTVPLVFKFLMRRCCARDHRMRPTFAETCDFLALFKSIVLNTKRRDGYTTPLYMGIGIDVLLKLKSYLGGEWLQEEAVSLGIRAMHSRDPVEMDEILKRLGVTNKVAVVES